MLAPILVFAYNRPIHLSQTLTALSQNSLAKNSDLFIFCDGAKERATISQHNLIAETRRIAHSEKRFRTIHIIERDTNFGLARSIIEGVSMVIKQFNRVIVLEDDLLTSPFFLKYMNMALDYYEKRPGVMSISANRPPQSKMKIPADYEYDVFACLRSYSTGWATWEDRWNSVDWTLDYLDAFLRSPEQIKAFNRGGDDLTELLVLQRDGKIDSWAIRFGFAHFKEHCVAILPCISYVDNIGFDGTGRHSGISLTGEYRNDLSKSIENPRFLDIVYEDSRIINAFYNRFCRKKRPLWQRLINYCSRLIGFEAPFVIKRKIYK